MIDLRKYNGEDIFFSADHHFDHFNAIKYANRPFATVGHMDDTMIRRWNERVRPNDIVFHLGDFTLGDKADKYFAELNGKIYVLANETHHDRRWLAGYPDIQAKHWPIRYIVPLYTLVLPWMKSTPIVLCHFPLAVWDRKHYGALHLHAHSHCNFPDEPRMMDVGVDCHNFYPVSLQHVLDTLT